MECPNCEKPGPYIEENGYEILHSTDRQGEYRCEDCDHKFWWP